MKKGIFIEFNCKCGNSWHRLTTHPTMEKRSGVYFEKCLSCEREIRGVRI